MRTTLFNLIIELYTIIAVIIFCFHNYCNYCTQLKKLFYENFNSCKGNQTHSANNTREDSMKLEPQSKNPNLKNFEKVL